MPGAAFSRNDYNKMADRSGYISNPEERRPGNIKINVDEKQVKSCIKLLADPDRRQWITTFLQDNCEKFDLVSLTQEDDSAHRVVYEEWTSRIDDFFDEFTAPLTPASPFDAADGYGYGNRSNTSEHDSSSDDANNPDPQAVDYLLGRIKSLLTEPSVTAEVKDAELLHLSEVAVLIYNCDYQNFRMAMNAACAVYHPDSGSSLEMPPCPTELFCPHIFEGNVVAPATEAEVNPNDPALFGPDFSKKILKQMMPADTGSLRILCQEPSLRAARWKATGGDVIAMTTILDCDAERFQTIWPASVLPFAIAKMKTLKWDTNDFTLLMDVTLEVPFFWKWIVAVPSKHTVKMYSERCGVTGTFKNVSCAWDVTQQKMHNGYMDFRTTNIVYPLPSTKKCIVLTVTNISKPVDVLPNRILTNHGRQIIVNWRTMVLQTGALKKSKKKKEKKRAKGVPETVWETHAQSSEDSKSTPQPEASARPGWSMETLAAAYENETDFKPGVGTIKEE